MAYKYRAYTPDKKIVQGTLEAASESVAEVALYQLGYQRVLSLREVRPEPSLEKLIPTLFGVKPQDVIDFSHQLATLIESGVDILTALQLLEGQASRPALRKIIAGLAGELRGGSSLSQALGKYPDAFSHTYCQVMKASEQAGNLEVGLRQVAGYMEKQMTMAKKITRAMAYPVLVLLMAVGVFALLITVALPPLVGLFNSLGAELPATTRLLIAAADFLINYKLYLLGGLLILVISIVGYMRLPAGKLTRDRLMLKTPVLGSINIQRNMCHFCQTTSMMLKAGLRLPQIMEIVIQTVGNRIIRQALKDVREGLLQGKGLSQPIISTLISMIEPLLTVVIGLVVIFMALSLVTPLYSILRSMH